VTTYLPISKKKDYRFTILFFRKERFTILVDKITNNTGANASVIFFHSMLMLCVVQVKGTMWTRWNLKQDCIVCIKEEDNCIFCLLPLLTFFKVLLRFGPSGMSIYVLIEISSMYFTYHIIFTSVIRLLYFAHAMSVLITRICYCYSTCVGRSICQNGGCNS
jgi:hypothetical protein